MNFIISAVLLAGFTGYAIFVIRMLLGLYVRQPAVAENPADWPDVTAIVAARNEAETLPGLLADLEQQVYAGNFNCVVADDRSTDGTWSLINRFEKTHPWFKAVRIQESSQALTGKKNALTQCIKHTTSELILETDADCRVGPEWVAAMAARFAPETGIVVGISSVAGNSFFARLQAMDFMGIMMSNAGMMNLGKVWSGSGQNLGFRRSLFTAISGFTGRDNPVMADDFYLVQEIGKYPQTDARIAWDPRAHVTTRPVETLKDFYRQRVRWASDTRRLWHQDSLFFLFLLAAFVLNSALLVSLLSGQTGVLFQIVVALKFMGEGLVTGYGFQQIGRLQDMWVFIPWFLVQPVYIPIMGLAGLFGKVHWK